MNLNGQNNPQRGDSERIGGNGFWENPDPISYVEDHERENDKKMTLEFELDKMGSPIPTWTNKG